MRKRTRWLVSLSVLALGSWFLYRENNVIDVSRMMVTSSRLPEAFDGYRVVQIADLHGKAFGNEQKRLLKKIDREKPDLVVMTGDLIDSRRNGEEAALTLMKALVDRYPVYFVTGNHEVRLNLTRRYVDDWRPVPRTVQFHHGPFRANNRCLFAKLTGHEFPGICL